MISAHEIHDAKILDPEAGILFDGPFADQNEDGDETPTWLVSLVDSAGDDFGPVEEFSDYDSARYRAKQLVNDYGLRYQDDASRA